MKVFFDTNVLLDVLLRREPFLTDSRRVWSLAERGKAVGMLSVLTLPSIYYLARKAADHSAALAMIRLIRGTFSLVPFDQGILDQALASDFPDFEDAIQYFSARKAEADCILTRDAGHFASASIPVLSPEQFLVTYSFE